MKRINVAKWLPQYNRWQIKVQKNGVRRTFACSTPGRAGQRLCHAKADAWLENDLCHTNLRVEQLFDDYLETMKQTTSRGNWAKIESFGKVWLKPVLGKQKIDNLNEQQLQDIINKGYAKGLARKTLTNMRAMLMHFIKYCRKRRATTLFPESLTIPKGSKRVQKNILQPEHLIRLFQSDETILRGKRVSDPLIHAYRFQVLTGLRPGELLGLQWSDIKGTEIFITRSINEYQEITTGKNDNAIRRFFATETAAAELRAQRQISTDERVFGTIKPQTYRSHWYRYCDANNLPHITPYEMRHTFVSIAKNLSEGQVKQLVGHSKNMDTFGVYGHELKGELQKTAHQLNNIFVDLLKTAE